MKKYYLDIIDIDKYEYDDLFSHFNTPYITKYLMFFCIIHKSQFRLLRPLFTIVFTICRTACTG